MTDAYEAVDLFAGPGGWDVAARSLGLSVLGIEYDDAACSTREAAGHATVKGDVAAVDPRDYSARGLTGSPPCPTFSAAGNGAGRGLTAIILRCAQALVDGHDTRHEARAEARRTLDLTADVATLPEPRSERKREQRRRSPDRAVRVKAREKKRVRAERDAVMSVLVVEPIRWAVANRPEWIALEQVPPVLALWRAFADMLATLGYQTWAGILEAERYGVPQTRERAILLARLDGQPHPPAPTHQRYVPGEPQRHDVTLEGEVLPWVSMAEALGWGMSARPGVTVAPGTFGGGPDPLGGGSGARKAVHRERNAGRWAIRATNDRPNGSTRPAPAPAPAPAMAFGHNAPVWVADRPSTNVNGDPRISAPGHHDPGQSGSQQEGAIRVTPQEAAVLQSFPADYPWQGSRTKVFQQIGNAVPPLLARAVLGALLGIEVEPVAGGMATDGESWANHRPATTVVGTRRSDAGMLIGRQMTQGEGRNVGGHGWNEEGGGTDSPRRAPDGREAAPDGSTGADDAGRRAGERRSGVEA